MPTQRTQKWLLTTVTTLAVVAAPLSAGENGPSAYPDAKNEAAWPGRGPIRVFNWMSKTRDGFWKNREKDQEAVVFVGDALTSEWDAKLMAEAFPVLKVANRGVAGDVSR